MRVKTEERRQAILEKAGEVFREVGFDRASMSEIAANVGGSKATLYSYFPSKEELFVAVMKQSAEVSDTFSAFADPSAIKIGSFEELRQFLVAFGIRYLKLQTLPNALAVRRSLIAHGDRSDLGKICFEAGPMIQLMKVAAFLERMMKEGYLREEVPWVAMSHLTHLLESGFIIPRLLGLVQEFPPGAIEYAAPRSVEVFLRGYAMPEHLGLEPKREGRLTKKAEVV
jgi:AcrR family transcriptional regulator